MIKKNIVLALVCFLIQQKSFAQTLNYYFGNLHAHTSYSDGNKDSASSSMTTPYEGFIYAKQSQHIDFYGISEHNHESAGIKSALYYNRGLRDADSVTIDGQFIAMYGMEWGVISSGGHALVYGLDSLAGWDFGNTEIYIAEADYTKLWNTINRKPGSFASLAHPQSGDYDNLLSVALNVNANNAICATALRSGPAFSTNSSYSNPASGNYLSMYNNALKLGYHIGPSIDHDTHNSVFGRQTKGRIAIISPLLTRTELIEGIRRRRIYASDDWNIKVNYSILSQPMGSAIETAGNPTVNVQLTDPDNETATSIALYYGVPGSGNNPTVLTTVNNTNTLNYTHSISNGNEYYYYLYIIQADGDKIWTAPIWYKRNDAFVAQSPIAEFSNFKLACEKNFYQLSDSSTNAVAWWWNIAGANITQSSLQNPKVTFTNSGTYAVTLTVTNLQGMQSSITKNIQVIVPPFITINSIDTICKGKPITVVANGASSFKWYNGNTNDSITLSLGTTTNVFVDAFYAGCTLRAYKKIVVYQALVTPGVAIVGDSIKSTYTTGNLWYFSGIYNPSITTSTFLPDTNGQYSTYIIDPNGCKSEMSNIVNYRKVGLADISSNENLMMVYPVPSNGNFLIKPFTSEIIQELIMFDISGKIVLRSSVEHQSFNELEANASVLASGRYTLHIKTAGYTYVKQITIEK